ncbi:pentapeptide repeat-containing protein [Rhodococcus jostii]|uniref:Pentapeptide repeat-containing protein n=1 Tax=Rhodococcus jostii TaxID=132919 RepID=A0ABU4CP65_RHOJO|nr:pentapeptide repeat-containing protein [Rhodococcus jostii]MDV6284995.1 pentapeptide repeat-containing protein [Rhodococcus jostii]
MSTTNTKSDPAQLVPAKDIRLRFEYFVVTSIVMFVGWWIVAEAATADGVDVRWNWRCWQWIGFGALLLVPAFLTAGFAPRLHRGWTERIKPDGKNVSLKALIVGGIIVTFILAGSHYYWQAETLTAAGESVWSLESREVLDVSRSVAFSLGALGAIAALLVGYRRQKTTEEAHDHEVDKARADRKLERTKQEDEGVARLHDRFTKAVEQLANGDPTIRLGAVYVLGALAFDWLAVREFRQRQVCVDMLCAYLRSTPKISADVAEDQRDTHILDALKKDQDVRKAALQTLSEINTLHATRGEIPSPGLAQSHRDLYRRQTEKGPIPETRIDLNGITLRGLDLRHVNLAHLPLDGADLTDANLESANLTRTTLSNATLDNATLDGAKLIRTNLRLASLKGVSLIGALLFRPALQMATITTRENPFGSFTRSVLVGVRLHNVWEFSAKGMLVTMDDETFDHNSGYMDVDEPKDGTPGRRNIAEKNDEYERVKELIDAINPEIPSQTFSLITTLTIARGVTKKKEDSAGGGDPA